MCQAKVAQNNSNKCSNFFLFWRNLKNEGAWAQKSLFWLFY